MLSIAVIYGSTRSNGNTEILTKQAVENIKVDSIYLNDFNIDSIEDKRHDEEGFPIVEDDYDALLSRMMQHDTFIFATPIYWYSMSGQMKNFVDRWSQTMKDSRFKDFKERMSHKKAYVIAVGGDSPYIKGLPLIQQFTYIFDFFGLAFEGYIIGEANKPGDIYNDKQAMCAAKQLRKKLI